MEYAIPLREFSTQYTDAGDIVKRGEWAKAFLAALGNSNPDAKTVNFVASWTLSENTPATYNPLGTTQEMPGATDYNWVGVKNYVSHEQGLEANVKTVQNGRYPHILHGIQTNDPEEAANIGELIIWGSGPLAIDLWRTGDHTQEALPSHTGGTSSGGSWGDSPLGFLNPADPRYDEAFAAQETALTPEAITRNFSFIALGGLLLIVALTLAIRTYVPTQQIVKTIAAVA